MTEENWQSPQSSSDQDTSSPSSPPPQIGRGAKIANDIGEHAEALLNSLRQLSGVGEDVVETNTSDEVVPSSNAEFSSTEGQTHRQTYQKSYPRRLAATHQRNENKDGYRSG
jgi:hypothetical protein